MGGIIIIEVKEMTLEELQKQLKDINASLDQTQARKQEILEAMRMLESHKYFQVGGYYCNATCAMTITDKKDTNTFVCNFISLTDGSVEFFRRDKILDPLEWTKLSQESYERIFNIYLNARDEIQNLIDHN